MRSVPVDGSASATTTGAAFAHAGHLSRNRWLRPTGSSSARARHHHHGHQHQRRCPVRAPGRRRHRLQLQAHQGVQHQHVLGPDLADRMVEPTASSARYSLSSSSRAAARGWRRTIARYMSAKLIPPRIMKTVITHWVDCGEASIESRLRREASGRDRRQRVRERLERRHLVVGAG